MCQEGSNLNPDLGELVVIPLYPKEKCNLFRPVDETEKRCQVDQRRVVLTTSCGESLIWSHTVKFVIDVGVERRQVITILGARVGQPSPAPTWVPANTSGQKMRVHGNPRFSLFDQTCTEWLQPSVKVLAVSH